MQINIGLDIARTEHLADKSFYNHNYYKIYPQGYDCYFSNGFDILFELCHEDEGCFDYTLGRFEEDRFIGALSWTHYGHDSILED